MTDTTSHKAYVCVHKDGHIYWNHAHVDSQAVRSAMSMFYKHIPDSDLFIVPCTLSFQNEDNPLYVAPKKDEPKYVKLYHTCQRKSGDSIFYSMNYQEKTAEIAKTWRQTHSSRGNYIESYVYQKLASKITEDDRFYIEHYSAQPDDWEPVSPNYVTEQHTCYRDPDNMVNEGDWLYIIVGDELVPCVAKENDVSVDTSGEILVQLRGSHVAPHLNNGEIGQMKVQTFALTRETQFEDPFDQYDLDKIEYKE